MPLDVSTLRTLLPERRIHYFSSTTSTMGEAARLAAAGAPSGTVVLAEEQTAGRGRMGREWYSEADSGLYLTLILHRGHPVPWLTLAVGLALGEAIGLFVEGRAAVDIRWPNDVLLGGRKCAGILVTSDGEAMLVGIGINVNHEVFPDELAELATSMRRATGRAHSREELLVRLLGLIDEYLLLPVEVIRERFAKASSYASGLRVELEDSGISGVTCGLDPEGFLLLRLDNGQIERIVAGGVRPASAD